VDEGVAGLHDGNLRVAAGKDQSCNTPLMAIKHPPSQTSTPPNQSQCAENTINQPEISPRLGE